MGCLVKIHMNCSAVGTYKQLDFGKAQKVSLLSLKTLTSSFQWDWKEE